MECVPGDVSGFDLLCDGPVNALVVGADALLALLILGHGLHQAGPAFARVPAACPGLAVLDDMLALRAVGIVPVFLEVVFIDAHFAGHLGRGCFCSWLYVRGAFVEADALPVAACLSLVGDGLDERHRLGVPSILLGPSRDRPGSRHVAILVADDEGVAVPVVAQESALSAKGPGVAMRIMPWPFGGVPV